MNHHLKVSTQEFTDLKGKKRHIITKPGDHQKGDTLTVTQDGTREQMSLMIDSIEHLHSRSVILGLFAPYANDQAKYVTSDIPASVGGGAKTLSNLQEFL